MTPGSENATVVETWCLPGTSPMDPDMFHSTPVAVPKAEEKESVCRGGVAAGAPTKLAPRS